MHVDLIRKIRNTLNINPDSKSTLVKKEHLLLYAKKLYEQNKQLKSILHPQIPPELRDTEAKLEEINASLIAYETQLHQEQQKHENFKSTVKYYQQFLEESKKTIEEHEEQIKQTKETNIKRNKIKINTEKIQSLLNASSETTKEGDKAMVQLMKQFLQFSQKPEDNQLQPQQW